MAKIQKTVNLNPGFSNINNGDKYMGNVVLAKIGPQESFLLKAQGRFHSQKWKLFLIFSNFFEKPLIHI